MGGQGWGGERVRGSRGGSWSRGRGLVGCNVGVGGDVGYGDVNQE